MLAWLPSQGQIWLTSIPITNIRTHSIILDYSYVNLLSCQSHPSKQTNSTLTRYNSIPFISKHKSWNNLVQHHKQHHRKVMLSSFHLNGHVYNLIHRLKR